MRFTAFITMIVLFVLLLPAPAQAIYDPLSVPNNRVGIHILFPDEIEAAAKLVNNNGKGEWGYVTVPIQATDRNRPKWQQFFDRCKALKVIPIIRVATVPEKSNWVQPNNYDLIDFANFLGDLKWPTANKYVIIFNEVNRSDEYGGFVEPEDYADILANASDIFKQVSPDFFILPAALDNAAPNGKGFMSYRRYIERMYLHRPDIFSKIDGWNSHAYPNPDFSARPDYSGSNKINSYLYDLDYIRKFTTKKLPVFITETGWSDKYLSDQQIGYYYKYAFEKVWSDKRIVAVTPFLLNAQDGPFVQFSFTDKQGQLKEFARTVSSYATVGTPLLTGTELSASLATPAATNESPSPFTTITRNSAFQALSGLVKIFTSIFGLYWPK